MMAPSSPELKTKYTAILKENGIEDEILDVTITKPDLRGLHMASIIDTARIDFVSGRDPLHLFLKKTLQMPVPEMEESLSRIMLNEGTFLTDFVQEMKDFRAQRNAGPDMSDLFPRVYYKDKEMIIQEDLTKRGFTIMPKEVKRTFDETKVVFEHLSRFHAVTHVMIARVGGPEGFLKSRPYLAEMFKIPQMREIISQTFDTSFDHCFSLINLSTCEDKEEKKDLLEKYKGKLFDAFLETIDAETLIYAVNHGDCWSNNMMLDTGVTNKKLIFVDLQYPRVNSPNMDLIKFLFASAAPDVRKRWKELLQYYFNKLREYVLALEHPFPFLFEDFVKDFSRKGKMDLFFALMMVLGFEAIKTHDTEGTHDLADVNTLFETWTKNNPEKVSKIGDEMVEMINDFLLFAEL